MTKLSQRLTTKHLMIILTLLIAFWLRTHRLTDLPPGLHYDEAANGILAGDIGLRGYRPIFITSYTGKETLFFYLAGFVMHFVGQSVFTLRLTSAFIAILTLASLIWLGREIAFVIEKEGDVKFSQTGTFTLLLAILLATSFPHLIFSRLGFRAITQPLLQCLTVAATLNGVRTKRWLSFIVAGLFLGLSAYTYLAVRLFPILFGIFLLPLLRRWWRQIAVLITVASIVIAPLVWFFWQNPAAFWVRIGQVGGSETGFADYATSFWQSLAMFGSQGDPYWRFNIPFKPLLEQGWFFAWIFSLGLLLWWLPKARGERLAVILLLLLTPLIMILPTALALDEIVPSNLRAIGVFPFILVPIALLLATIIDGLPSLAQESAAPIILISMFFLVGVDYFQNWGTRTDVFYDSDADMVALAGYIDAHSAEYDAIYVGSIHYRHPTMAFSAESYDQIKWLVGSDAIVIPDDQHAMLAFPNSSLPPAWLLAQDPAFVANGPDDQPLFMIYDSADVVLPEPDHKQTLQADGTPGNRATNFSDVLQFEGYSIVDQATIRPILRLHWRVLGSTDQPFAPFVHVIDQTGFRWLQVETSAYPAEQWQPGEHIVQEIALPLPAAMPHSRQSDQQASYRLVVGLFAGETRLPLIDADGKFAGNTLQTYLQLAGNGAMPSRQPQQPIGTEVMPGVSLLGIDQVPTSAESGQTLSLTLFWQIEQVLPDQSFAITLSTDDGAVNTLTTSFLPTQADVPFYAIQNINLPLGEMAQSGDLGILFEDGLIFGRIEVIPVERIFTPPSVAVQSAANFDNQISLHGYSLTRKSSTSLQLDLVWQSLADLDEAYTVFVHVLNPDGSCCAWQQDTMPQQAAYPTTRWVTGEFVTDRYEIAFDQSPGAVYPIEIGLYLAEDGQRLTIIGGSDHLFLEPIE